MTDNWKVIPAYKTLNHIQGLPLEFGNPEQIKWLKKQAKEFHGKLEKGIELDADLIKGEKGETHQFWKIDFTVNCFIPNCPGLVTDTEQVLLLTGSDMEDALINYADTLQKKITCTHCQSEYTIYEFALRAVYLKKRDCIIEPIYYGSYEGN